MRPTRSRRGIRAGLAAAAAALALGLAACSTTPQAPSAGCRPQLGRWRV